MATAPTTDLDLTAKRWTERLRKLVDPALVTYYNRYRRVWVVDRCTNPEASSLIHVCGPHCLKANVLVLQPGEPPSDRTIAQLKSMDTWDRFGREKAPEAMLKLDQEISDAEALRRKLLVDQNWRNIARDNKIQWRKAFNLFERHDMSRIHK